MTRPLRIQYQDAYYHVTCRGNDRKAIFRTDEDQSIFLDQLHRSLDIFNVALLSYACMTNHFYFLLTTPEGNLSEFMRHFNLSYTAAFNRRHRRTGHLYQGRYKSFLIDADNYLLEVSRYIHLNSMRMKSDENLNVRWSNLLGSDQTSVPGYLYKKMRKPFINYSIVLGYMGGDTKEGRRKYYDFLEQGIKGPLESPLRLGRGAGIVGDENFVSEIKARLGLKGKPSREQPETRLLSRHFTPDELIDAFSKIVGVDRGVLLARGRQSIERSMLMELMYRYCRLSQPEIGRLCGIDYSAVSQARKRFRTRLAQDSTLRKRYQLIQEQISEI